MSKKVIMHRASIAAKNVFQTMLEIIKPDVTPKLVWQRAPQLRSSDIETPVTELAVATWS